MKLIICILGLAAMAVADEDLTGIKWGNDKLTAKMLHEVATSPSNAGKNVVLSAFSVLPPLAQLSLASVGESHDELLNVIGLRNDNDTKTAFTKLKQQIRSVKGVELKMANRIYVAQDAVVNPDFAAVSRDVFDSDVRNIDFSDSGPAVETINTWVEEKTNEKIKDLLSPGDVDGTTRAVLVNAIYFKGLWEHPFKKDQTLLKDFHVSNDKTIKVPTMQQTADLLYGESQELDAKLLELKYEGGEASFLVVLPNQRDGLTQLVDKLKDPTRLNKAVAEMTTHNVFVELPKFKIETKTNLKEVLQKLQVTKMFDPNAARLENLLQNESNLYISGAIQKAFIEVNEEGAEAAAANAFFMSRSARILPHYVRKNFIVDHPFYYELKHESNTLFNGFYQS